MVRSDTRRNKYSQLGLLLVDDQKAARILLRSYLNRLGVGDVEEATDSLEALRILMQTRAADCPFEAIFVSRSLREMSGLNLVKNIRLLAGWKDFPIVLISEDLDPSLAIEANKTGATEYLIRPYSEERLKAVLDRIYALTATV